MTMSMGPSWRAGAGSAIQRVANHVAARGDATGTLALQPMGASTGSSRDSARAEAELLDEMGQGLHGRLAPKLLRIPIREERPGGRILDAPVELDARIAVLLPETLEDRLAVIVVELLVDGQGLLRASGEELLHDRRALAPFRRCAFHGALLQLQILGGGRALLQA